MHLDVIIPGFIADALASVDCLGFSGPKEALGNCILYPDYASVWDLSSMSPVDRVCLSYFIAEQTAGRYIDSVTVVA